MSEHSWCQNIPCDEAVRASEDGRSVPPPTLEEAISAVTERRPVDAGGRGNVTGLRAERVTLEVTHDLDAPLGECIVQVLDESLGYDETVRVVDETAERITQALTADRFAAAVADADRLRARVAELESAPAASGAAGAEVVAWGIANPGNPIFGNQKVWAVRATEEIAKDVYRSCNGWVHFPLYAAPQPAKGWLTAEERKWVEYMSGNCVLPYAGMKCMEAILARSSPPEVVLPEERDWYDGSGGRVGAFDPAKTRAALAAAGVTVKEVSRG